MTDSLLLSNTLCLYPLQQEVFWGFNQWHGFCYWNRDVKCNGFSILNQSISLWRPQSPRNFNICFALFALRECSHLAKYLTFDEKNIPVHMLLKCWLHLLWFLEISNEQSFSYFAIILTLGINLFQPFHFYFDTFSKCNIFSCKRTQQMPKNTP